MEQSTEGSTQGHPDAVARAPRVTVLQDYMYKGDATPSNAAGVVATPAALAVMFADLAARFAGMTLPDGAHLRVSVGVQPFASHRHGEEAERVAVLDAAAAALLPGVEAGRHLFGMAAQYTAGALTPAGLNVQIYTGVELTDAEARRAREAAS